MLPDAVQADVTAAEVVALARLATDEPVAPPPHLRDELQEKGWMTETESGDYLLTPEGRTLVEKAN
ncbi:MAG TPA: hypothetical protein VIN06_18185 [Devosia sp.]